MKKIFTSSKYRFNWYRIMLFSVTMVLTGTYSITAKGQTAVPLMVNASFRAEDEQSIALTSTSANTGKTNGSGTITIGDTGVANQNILAIETNQESKTLGNTDVYNFISTLPYRRAQPVTFSESGEIESMSIYHNGGTGNLLLGVYSDEAGSPLSLLGVTAPTPINSTAGWQTISLLSPVIVTAGTTVWLSWVFENNPGIRYTSGTPGRVKSMDTWSAGMPATFGATTYADYIYSVYSTYKPVNTTPTLSVSTETISLGYGSWFSGTFNIASNTSWSVSTDANWLDVSPASGSNNGTITLTTNTANTGTSPRTATITISGAGVADRTLTVTQAYRVKTLGNTDVYSLISTAEYRKAQPITFSESGKIESLSVYHSGGTGNVLMGVYSDQSGSPATLLGVTESTPINTEEGWQTIPLKSPVEVASGHTVWLSWVFENNPGIRYTSGTPGRIKSTETWPEGMPETFGTGVYADYKYSVYCTYIQVNITPKLNVSERYISLGFDSGSIGTFNITSNTSWNISITDSAGWIEVSPVSGYNNGTITLKAKSPNIGNQRESLLTISGTGVENKLLIVNQEYRIDSLGNTDVYNFIDNSENRTAQSVIFDEPGEIESISIYHNGGTGNVMLGVYADEAGSPSKLLGITEEYGSIGINAGWLTIRLKSPVAVTSGQTVWLSWIFENNPGISYTPGTPGSVMSTATWIERMPVFFGPASATDYKYSVFCTYKTFKRANETTTLSIAPTTISLGADISLSGKFNITSNTNWSISDNAKWLDVLTESGSYNGTITVRANSKNNGTSPRTAIVTITGAETAGKTVTVTQAYKPFTRGNTVVYDLTSTTEYRKAQPVTFFESGDIDSISVYHNGGTGKVLLGVYSDQAGSPSALLGESDPTPINATAGWQTISLTSTVNVLTSQTVWLSWVFEKNPGIRYTSGDPSTKESTETWPGGLPITFGNANNTSLKYSVYCIYKPGPKLRVDYTSVSLDFFSGSSRTISITSNTSWDVINNTNWLTVSPVSDSCNGTITFTANSANPETSPRTAIVYLNGAGVEGITLPVTQAGKIPILGNTDVYSLVSTSPYRQAQPITFTEFGEIKSISVYHNGGTGNVLLGVYSDQAGSPLSLLGVTSLTEVNSTEGWQTVPFTSPVIVASGQTVWLSWVFENNPGIRYTTGVPATAESGETWPDGMPITFGTADYTDFKYSVYCTFEPANVSTPSYSTMGNPEIFNLTSTATNMQAMFIGGQVLYGASITSISIYHNGGTGKVMMGIYYTEGSQKSTFQLLAVTAPTIINPSAGWQTVQLIKPCGTGNRFGDLWLAWMFENNPGIRYTTKTDASIESAATWAEGMAATLGTTINTDKAYSVYCTYTDGIRTFKGNREVYDLSSKSANRCAIPIMGFSDQLLESISVYHNGGTGNVILGVYSSSDFENGSPKNLLGVTAPTEVNPNKGWQTIPLITPIMLKSSFPEVPLWLAWVFESNPGIRYTAGEPPMAQSTATWSGGMPESFGDANFENYKYSIYCTYFKEYSSDYKLPFYSPNDSTSFTSVKLNKDELLIFPNPTTGNITVKWNSPNHERMILTVYNALGQEVKKVQTEPGINEISVDLSKVKKGIYMVELKESGNGTILSRSKIVRN
ncbi:MAG: BACON domain-containing carbohydrate-binding protein [Bacteroidales bacterium]|nr:BACON domain-containing carbohydrate-binding protein [Bacteroidales bacterium]